MHEPISDEELAWWEHSYTESPVPVQLLRIRLGASGVDALCRDCQGYPATSLDGWCDGCAFIRTGLPHYTYRAWRTAQGLGREGLVAFDVNAYNDALADSNPVHPFLKAEDRKRMAEGGTLFDIIGCEYREETFNQKLQKKIGANYLFTLNMPDGTPLGKLGIPVGIENRDLRMAMLHEHFQNGSGPIKNWKLIVAFITNYGNPSYDMVPAENAA